MCVYIYCMLLYICLFFSAQDPHSVSKNSASQMREIDVNAGQKQTNWENKIIWTSAASGTQDGQVIF